MMRRLPAGTTEPGANRALEILSTELVRAMQLSGVRSPAEITADLLQ